MCGMTRILPKALSLAIMAPVVILSPAVASTAAAPAHQAPMPPQVTTAFVPSERQTTPTIRISGFAFAVPRSVRPGARIRVVNRDTAPHTVTSAGGAFSVSIPAGASRTLRAPARVGTYRFYCQFHPHMRGRLQVR